VPQQTFDTREHSNRGYEFELTANLTPNWRLSLNAARPDAYQANAFLNTRQFFADNDDVMRQILTDAGVLINAANAWNSIVFKASLVTGQPPSARRVRLRQDPDVVVLQ
jgi:hypothetical protein